MPLTVSNAWLAGMAGGAKPIWMVELLCGPFSFVNVSADVVAQGAGDTLTVAASGVTTVVLTEGVDFARGASANDCATNIAAAQNTVGALEIGAAFMGAGVVAFYPRAATPTFTRIVLTTSDENAWVTNGITPVERNQRFVSAPETITDGSPGITQRSTHQYPSIVASVSAVSLELNPLTRKTTVGGITVTFIDGDDRIIEDLLTRVPMKGQDINLYLGSDRMEPSTYRLVGTWTVDKVFRTYAQIVFECVEQTIAFKDIEVTPNMKCPHPFAVIRTFIDLTAAGYRRDATSFDETQAAYSTIQHWAISNHRNYNIYDPGTRPGIQPDFISDVSADRVIDDLCRLTNSSIVQDENGQIVLKWYNPSAAIVDTWTANDVSDVRMEDVFYEIRTEFQGSGGSIEGAGDQRQRYVALRDDVTRNMLRSGGGPKEIVEPVDNEWVGSRGYLNNSITSAVGQAPAVLWAYDAGLSGSRVNNSASPYTQRSGDNLSATRIAYLLIMDNFGNREIVSANAVDATGTGLGTVPSEYYHPFPTVTTIPTVTPTGVGGFTGWPPGVIYTLNQRGLFGTAPRAWTGGVGLSTTARIDIVDVTVFASTLANQLARFNAGAPLISCRSSFEKFKYQVGDLIRFEHPLMVFWENRGTITTGDYEIVSKEISTGDSSGIKWKLCLARHASQRAPLTVYPTFSFPVFPPGDDPITDNAGVIVTDNVGNIAYR